MAIAGADKESDSDAGLMIVVCWLFAKGVVKYSVMWLPMLERSDLQLGSSLGLAVKNSEEGKEYPCAEMRSIMRRDNNLAHYIHRTGCVIFRYR